MKNKGSAGGLAPVLVALAVLGNASLAVAALDEGANLLAQGDIAGAAAEFERSARTATTTDEAANGLFMAARLYEERLGEPERALVLYREILRVHGDTRVAIASSRRLEALSKLVQTELDASAFSKWREITRRFTEDTQGESFDAAARLLKDYPAWRGRFDVLRWLGDRHFDDRNWESAIDNYLSARAITTDAEQIASISRRLAESYARGGDFEKAELALSEPRLEIDSATRRMLDAARLDLERFRLRHRFYLAAAVVLVTGLLVLILQAARTLREQEHIWRHMLRPPLELVFVTPVLALFVLMSLTGHQDILGAVSLIATAGCLSTWLSGIAGRSRADSVLRLVTRMVALSATTLSAAYLAVHRDDLLDRLIETVRFGPHS